MSQIFKNTIEKEKLLVLLDEFAIKTDKYYKLDNIFFKKAKFEGAKLNEFYEYIKPFYHKSKLFYVERDRNYKNFITIVRQICKSLQIPYSSKIKYSKSSYDIHYFIYLD